MGYSLNWLPDVLLAAGLKVARQPGWETRGADSLGTPLGVMIHHTAGPRLGNMPSLATITNGRGASANSPALPGPLAHLGLGRDGTFYVVAARRANHAGKGSWAGITAGNSHFIGIECENMGLRADMPWPDVQMDALRRGCAAMLRQIGATAAMCCGHREYAPHRKIDPLFELNAFRADVAGLMAGRGSVRPQIKAADPQGRVTLRRGATGDLVVTLQKELGLTPADGLFGAHTEAALRAFQTAHGLVGDGIAGPRTWDALDKVPAA